MFVWGTGKRRTEVQRDSVKLQYLTCKIHRLRPATWHCFPAALENQLSWGSFTAFYFLGDLPLADVGSVCSGTKSLCYKNNMPLSLFCLKVGFVFSLSLFFSFCGRTFHSIAPQAFQ